MGRYAEYGQEVLIRNGKLVGFNAGYGFYAEHEYGYKGREQIKPKKLFDKNKKSLFNGEIVENPQLIHMIEFEDGNVWLMNNEWQYADLIRKTEQELKESMQRYIYNDDRKRSEDMMRRFGEYDIKAPEIIALWNDGNFDLISTNERSSELIRRLYSEMQRGNVAISSDYSFMFKDRGLSFVLLDQLSKDDLLRRQLVDNQNEVKEKFQEEYSKYIKEEGVGEFEEKYPIGFWNLQISKLKDTPKGIAPEFYLELYHINHGQWNNDSCLFNVTHRMSGDEIKFLVPVTKTKEFEEFANNHSKEEIEEYINAQLEKYHEQQRTEEEQGYQIGEVSLEEIAAEQKSGTIEKTSSSLKNKVEKWLHPDREKDKTEAKGE